MNQPAPTPQMHPALVRFRDELLQAGMDEESVGFITGKLVADISIQVANHLAEVVGAEQLEEFNKIEDDAQRNEALSAAFQEKESISLEEYHGQLIEEKIQEFEALD